MKQAILTVAIVLLCIVVHAEEEQQPKMAAEVDATCRRADDAYAEAIKKAEAALEKARKEALAAKLKVYKERLVKTTQAGDFDRASVIKAAIEKLEAKEPAPTKPKDALKYDGHWYATIREKVPWHVAKRKCEEMGGQLACLETDAESQWLAQQLHSAQLAAWIGCTDEDHEGKWMWVNGKTAKLSNMAIDNTDEREHAIHWAPGSANWNDMVSDVRMFYVCEWDK